LGDYDLSDQGKDEKSSKKKRKYQSKGFVLMNLVMLDIDGTLTQSYEYDREIFGLAIGEVLGRQPVDADLNSYVDKTSTGVTVEAIRRATGRSPEVGEIEQVKNNVLRRLKNLYQESPSVFSEVPGAAYFLEQLRGLDGAVIAIATGCWLSEAQFKLQASGLLVDGIPLATSDDDRNRKNIMQIACENALDFYACSRFEKVVYLGDGPWDLQASHALGYGFIGIGSRIQSEKDAEEFFWHQDFLEVDAVLASLAALLKS
jgi:phosphoglycolate phosphatase-like HAD superfamily hydrolase